MARAIALLTTIAALVVGVAPAGASPGWHLVRSVVLIRHGVRPPNSNPPLPPSIAPDEWPTWDVPPGWLTDHGAAAIRLVASADARRFAAEGILATDGCPAADAVHIVSDSLERTIRTGDEYASALAPNCGLHNQHSPQGVADPLFADYSDSGISDESAAGAVDSAIGPGGAGALAARNQYALDGVTRILCGDYPGDCGLTGMLSGVEVDPTGRHRPHLTGALAHGSVAAEVLTLEYADGKPMSDVGWGRATPDDLRTVGLLHPLELSIIARPRPLALANAGKIAGAIREALMAGPNLTVLVGHDTDIANIAGLLGVHWSIPGFADDEPAPGGALMFDLLQDDGGHRYVRSSYRSQTLDQIRQLDSGDPTTVSVTPSSCDAQPCPLDTFVAALTRRS